MQSSHPSDFGDTRPTIEQMTSPLERDALPPGTLLGGCQIIEAISCDGHSILYLASDGALQRRVLIREHFPVRLVCRQGVVVSLLPGVDAQAGAGALEAFLREARLLARLDHPAIARVHRFWEEHRTAYIMMPFLPVQALAATLQRLHGPASEAWLRALLGPLLGALQVLHEQGCFHLGLSPDTISLLPDARPMLLDLSSANQVAGPGLPAHADSLDRLYVPIEQFSHGAGLGIGPWSDLYALAAVVHHAMLGRPPVSAAVLGPDDHLVTLAESLRARSDVSYSPSFVAAIDCALAVRPQDRPQDVTAFQRLLSQHDPNAAVISVSSLPPVLTDEPPASSVLNAAPPRAEPPKKPEAAVPAAAATAPSVKAPPAATVPPKPAAASPVSPLAQPPVDEAQVSPLAEAPAGDSQAIDPAVSAAIALAISSLPWDTKYEPNLAPGAPAAADRAAAAGSFDEPSLLSEFTSTMPAGPNTHPAAAAAPRRGRRWATAAAGVLAAVLGGWFALTRTEAPAQLAQWVEPAAASAPRGKGSSADPAAVAAATAPATAASHGTLPDEPTAAGPAASTDSARAAAADSVPGAAAAVSEAAATVRAAAASVPVSAPASAPVAAGPAPARADSQAGGGTPLRTADKASPKPTTLERNKSTERSVAEAAETEAAPASPRAACGTRTNFSLEYCMETQCKQARFSRHPQCRALR